LRKEKARWSDALADLLDAGAAALTPGSQGEGAADRATALGLLTSAIAGLEAADLALFAVAARHERLALQDDEAGRAAHAAASAWMAAAGVKSPARLAAMIAPGVGAPRG
jgi:hypothetical protein